MAGEMAQWTKSCLSITTRVVILSIHLNVVTHVCNPRTRDLEIEGSLVLVGNDSSQICEL